MSDDIIINNDIFSLEDQEHIKHYMTNAIPWYLGEGHEKTASPNQYSLSVNVFEYMQLCHGFVSNKKVTTEHRTFAEIMIKNLQTKYTFLGEIDSIKANLQTKVYNSNPLAHNTPHVDNDISHWVVLYYVNNSDGDTFIFNSNELSIRQRISPKQGQVVIFDGKLLHAGMHPREADYRIVINFNFLKS
jgi:hypothetical protein